MPVLATAATTKVANLDALTDAGKYVLNSRYDGPRWLPDGGHLSVEPGFGGDWLIQRFSSTTDPTYGGTRTGRFVGGTWQWFPWQPLRQGRYAGKRVAVLGGSIAASVARHLPSMLCAEVLNCSFGGTGWGPITAGEHHRQFDALCIYQLARYFREGSGQPAIDAAEELHAQTWGKRDFRWYASMFAEAVANPPDAVLVHSGTNDFARALGLDDFRNCVRTSIEDLSAAMPATDLILTTPLYRPAVPRNRIELTIDDYAKVLRKMAKHYRLKIIDLARESGLNELNAGARLVDGTHGSTAYDAALARQIASAL